MIRLILILALLLTPVFIALGLLVEYQGKKRKIRGFSIGDNWAVYIFPVIRALSLGHSASKLLIYMYKQYVEKLNAINKFYRCRHCDLLSRLGHIELVELSTGKKKCPHCGTKAKDGFSQNLYRDDSVSVDVKIPFSPKFTLRKFRELEELKKKNENNKLVDEQLELYIKLQKDIKEKMEKEGK